LARRGGSLSTDRLTVADTLEQLAAFLEFRGENQFRVRAFRNAAKAVLGLSGSVAEALADGSLAATRGIGPATVTIVTELLDTGRSTYLEELKQEIPSGLLDMLAVPGLGATRIKLLHDRLKIASLPELEAAARDGRLARLPGFGAKTAEKVLKGITFTRKTSAFRLSHHAAAEAEVLRSAVERLSGVTRVAVAGEVRRRCEVVSEFALVAQTALPAPEIRNALAQLPGLADFSGEAELLTFRSAAGMPASLRVTPPEQFGVALVQATGSAPHLEQLAVRATAQGYALTRNTLERAGRPVPTPDEATLYAALALREIPPELREGYAEVAQAAAGTLPQVLEPAELVGFLHCHTTYSDGTLSVEELALACRDAGFAYVGITDHSRSAAYAGGLSVESLQRQWDEIAAVQARLSGIRILKGIESDILADGALDYDDSVLAGLDFVIGSIHSRFSLGEAEMTARVIRALDNPYLTILGHPTGRLLLSRNAYPLDLEKVFARAAANGVALEINGDPHRLDLDWRLVRRARELGVLIAIGADAHGRSGIPYLGFGAAMARKAGLERGDVLNTRSADEFLAFAKARRR
jgi:DNA polymerase (family X)